MSGFDDIAFEVEFMSCVIDKADDLRVLESDSHFSDFTGVHPSKIKQGKLSFMDILSAGDREAVMKQLCKKHSPYVYLDFYIKNKNEDYIFVHCIGQNISGTTRSRLTLADVSQSEKKSEMLRHRADEMNKLIDLVEGGVCLFKVNQDMQIEPIYMNKACQRVFAKSKGFFSRGSQRIDKIVHKEDKSAVFQAIGSSMATKKPINIELRIMTGRSSYMWCKFDSAIQRYDDDGCPIFHAVFTDISKVKRAEQEADTERDDMVNIFKNLPGPLFCTDLETPFILDVVSEDFIGLIGYTRKEFFEELGGDFKNLIVGNPFEVRERFLEEVKAENNHIIKLTYQIKTKSGKVLNIIDRRRVVENDGGDMSTIGIIKDATATQISDDISL